MLLERLYDDWLAQASYLLACQQTKRAIIVDPNRDVDRYIAAAAHEKLTIAYVAETHIHADFVSGARELAHKTGAKLLLSGEGGTEWQYRFATGDGATLVRDGDEIDLGQVLLRVRHTPGHTPEHVCFVVTDRAASDRPIGMFSGDFVFVGDVGRPDLLERAANVRGTMDAMARSLFRSLRALSDLPDYLQLWPGHGPGSACGKALGAMPSTTLGYERIANWAFQTDDEDRFVAEVLAGQPEPPKYFATMKAVNRDGPPPAPPMTELPQIDLATFERVIEAGTPVIDVRSTAEFAAGHLPQVLNIPTGTSFITWAGSLLPYDRDLVLLADDEKRLSRARHGLCLIGLDRVTAWGGRDLRAEWQARNGNLQTIPYVDAKQLAASRDRRVIDVRGAAEWNEGHLSNAEHRFLGDLAAQLRDIPRDAPIAVHCQGGTRSAIAASLLQAQGFTDVANLAGGIKAWQAAGFPIERP
jgi:hydroxyacylglutathione hydrolase